MWCYVNRRSLRLVSDFKLVQVRVLQASCLRAVGSPVDEQVPHPRDKAAAACRVEEGGGAVSQAGPGTEGHGPPAIGAMAVL